MYCFILTALWPFVCWFQKQIIYFHKYCTEDMKECSGALYPCDNQVLDGHSHRLRRLWSAFLNFSVELFPWAWTSSQRTRNLSALRGLFVEFLLLLKEINITKNAIRIFSIRHQMRLGVTSWHFAFCPAGALSGLNMWKLRSVKNGIFMSQSTCRRCRLSWWPFVPWKNPDWNSNNRH